MGHLELNGFRVNQQITMDHGIDGDVFNKFERVFSSHNCEMWASLKVACPLAKPVIWVRFLWSKLILKNFLLYKSIIMTKF